MKEAFEEVSFGGETIKVFRYQPDWEVKINDIFFGFYTSPAAGINAAQQHIIRKLDEK